MLGSVMDAEDIVQETYLRYRERPTAGVAAPKAYLSKITTRLCLDHLKSAKANREQYIGTWLPEPLRTDDSADTLLEKSEMISTAALVLLEKLSPLERAVFLLREVFDYSYAEIADIVGKNEANCRQSYHRAKQSLRAGRNRFQPSAANHEKLVSGFLDAIHGDDVDALNHLLAEDVTLWSDGGGKAVAARRPLIGKDIVSQIFLRSARIRKHAYGELVEMNGEVAILVREEAQVIGAICLAGNNAHITDIWAVWNPDKLQHLQ
jgi:RNA polymerase sigma-70 factor (ECF subfamily)